MKNRMLDRAGKRVGRLERGHRNAITDVAGVSVGHVTLEDGDCQTGVTVVLPHQGNLFRDKVMAACHVMNGFGKTMGLMQLDELGTIETPIALTNTLSIGVAADALIKDALAHNPEIGGAAGTVNPIVCECNDGYLNAIREQRIRVDHVMEAIEAARNAHGPAVGLDAGAVGLDAGAVGFELGAVGAGRGMCCYGLKGGIGTASRIVEVDGERYVLGALALTNFGREGDLQAFGRTDFTGLQAPVERGSVIIILATDAPLTERQMGRICRRGAVGIIRTGSYMGGGSGDVIIGFSTKNGYAHFDETGEIPMARLPESSLDVFFRAAAEATEEAVLDSMLEAEAIVGQKGRCKPSLSSFI